MKKFRKISLIVVLVSLTISLILVGCQYTTKSLGGDMTLTLEPNQKLEEITWKDGSLWYLTRPMREDEEAETHVFQQSSNFGVFEGTVTIIETKEP